MAVADIFCGTAFSPSFSPFPSITFSAEGTSSIPLFLCSFLSLSMVVVNVFCDISFSPSSFPFPSIPMAGVDVLCGSSSWPSFLSFSSISKAPEDLFCRPTSSPSIFFGAFSPTSFFSTLFLPSVCIASFSEGLVGLFSSVSTATLVLSEDDFPPLEPFNTLSSSLFVFLGNSISFVLTFLILAPDSFLTASSFFSDSALLPLIFTSSDDSFSSFIIRKLKMGNAVLIYGNRLLMLKNDFDR
mmetsp:Transcript_41641/g.97475  ORF Transcript_41641/g.97475 Transcript_41641/m.97475 type:complete len:242 (-) Transcript_41641:84-809(-)